VSVVAREDEGLIRRCQAGDQRAFEDLVRKHQDRVYNLAYRLTDDADEAEDVTQEAFLRAFRNLESFEGGSSFYTWIYRITINVAISRRRHDAVRPKPASLGGQENGRPVAREDPASPDPSEAAQREEVRQIVGRAIAQLDAEHRVLVVLRDIEGRDYGEIAEVLDCPLGTVKSRLHRARCLLRDALAAQLPRGWIPT